MPIDAFLDSNDGFDDLILSAEANIAIPTNPITTTTTITTQKTVISDDLAAAFNDDDDDIFANFQWGSGNNKISEQTACALRNEPTSTSALTRGRNEIDESFSEWLHDDNDTNDDYVWGSAAKIARLSEVAPSAKKPKLQNSETGSKQDYSWGSSSRINAEESRVNVKCTGCHQPAKE